MKITELFERGEFVVSAEVGPPKGYILTFAGRSENLSERYHGGKRDR